MTGTNAVVVGAGFSGLAAAALLARAGYRVTVLEKSDRSGGRAAAFTHEGFTFDQGPTLLFMPDVFRTLFAACGADFDRDVQLVRLNPNYRLNFPSGATIDVSSSLPRTIASLERYEPGAGAGLLSYLAGAARAYELARSEFVGSRIRHWKDFLTIPKVAALAKSGALSPLQRVAGRAFRTAAPALSFQSMYLGMSPFQSPALYRLLFYTELGEGIFYPTGGIGALVAAMQSLAERSGATVVHNVAVTGFRREGTRVASVIAGDVEYTADVVVATADLPYVYDSLLGESTHRSNGMRRTPSALLLYVALERRYDDLRHHEFLMPQDLRQTCDDLFVASTFPRDPAIYLASPAATDPSMAPPGKDSLYVLVPAPNLRGDVNWTRDASRLANSILSRIEQRRLPGLRERIRWYRIRTPLDLKNELNLADGSAFGLSHDIFQIGPLRPDNRHRHYGNLFFAGASTRPATGLPLVVLGAMQTVERIREEIPA